MENEENKILEEGLEQKETPEVVPPTPTEDAPAVVEPDGTSPEGNETPIVEENGAFETSIKTFTQPDVDKIVGETRVKTREKTFNYIYNRYGVKNEEELDSLVANAQRFDTLKEEHDMEKASWDNERTERDRRLAEMSEEIALMKSDIDPARYEDAKLILKGKGLEVTLDNIQAEMETHPEWKKATEANVVEENVTEPAPVTTTTRIKALGNEPKAAPTMSEEEEAEKLFKLKFH